MAVAVPGAERADLRRPWRPARDLLLQPRRRPARRGRRGQAGLPAALLPRGHERTAGGREGALREQAHRRIRPARGLRRKLRPRRRAPAYRPRVTRTLAGRALLPLRRRRPRPRAARRHPPPPLAAPAGRRPPRAQQHGRSARACVELRAAAPLQRAPGHADLAAAALPTARRRDARLLTLAFGDGALVENQRSAPIAAVRRAAQRRCRAVGPRGGGTG